MTIIPRYPLLFQVNSRVWLQRLSYEAGKPLTLADIDDATIDGFAERGFDWIWMLSVWRTGAAGRAVSRGDPQWRAEFRKILPDLTEEDICGSGFAITAYSVSEALGGDAALARFREKLAKRGIRLMLDFVPNHTALDHVWVRDHPYYYVRGTEEARSRSPHNYAWIATGKGPRILAYGRDPNYAGWRDTLQLDYSNPAMQAAQIAELVSVAAKCDGVRCDMAMLVLPEIFQRTWGVTPEPFWPSATATVRERYPSFAFMAEVYWDLEWTLQQQGFDYCYDKRLYDRLKGVDVAAIRAHLAAGLPYQDKLARFLENHDELRAAHEFPWPRHRAATVITFLSPGLRFFHQGEFEGAQVRVPVHLCRGPREATNPDVDAFYARLLAILRGESVFREGAWSQIQPLPAWAGNWTWDGFVAFAWAGQGRRSIVVVVNYTGHQGQCRLRLPFADLRGKKLRLVDLMGSEVYERDGGTLLDEGLYIDHAPWQFNVFDLRSE